MSEPDPPESSEQDEHANPAAAKDPRHADPGAPPGLHSPRMGRAADPWTAWIRRAELLGADGGPMPAWMRETRGEPRWPVTLSVIAAIVLQILLPSHLTEPLPRPVLPSLEAALLVGLSIADPGRIERRGTLVRAASLVLILLITIANAASAVLLIKAILEGQAGNSATPLLATGANVWATNVIAFGLWYWELDRGGPVNRARGTSRYPDLMFPQMANPDLAPSDWEPQFVDYLYLGFTNATAFSPTDVMPLSRWAKLTMMVQSSVSLLIGALVIARAVNILRT